MGDHDETRVREILTNDTVVRGTRELVAESQSEASPLPECGTPRIGIPEELKIRMIGLPVRNETDVWSTEILESRQVVRHIGPDCLSVAL